MSFADKFPVVSAIGDFFNGEGANSEGVNGTRYYYSDPATSNYTQIRSQWGDGAANLYLDVNRFSNPFTISRLGAARRNADYAAGVASATQYSDNSLGYHYAGDPNGDMIVQTPGNWSGNGVPLAATQGANGWAVSKPLPAGEEFTTEELFKDYGLYWKGWSTEQVAGATTNLFGDMTNMSMEQSRSLSEQLYQQAAQRADAEVARFPSVSRRALDATNIASTALSDDMARQFNANLDTYLPGWRQKVVGPSGALSTASGDFAGVFRDNILPELSYNMLQTKALLQNASRPMAAGEVPMAVSLATLRANPESYGRSTASGRGMTARDLGLTALDMQKLGVAGLSASSNISSTVDKGVLGILGAPGDAARAHAATLGQFTPPVVDSGSIYGGIMQGLNAGSAMRPDQIFSLGMQSYESNLQSGMNLFSQLSQLAAQQAESFNKHNEATYGTGN